MHYNGKIWFILIWELGPTIGPKLGLHLYGASMQENLYSRFPTSLYQNQPAQLQRKLENQNFVCSKQANNNMADQSAHMGTLDCAAVPLLFPDSEDRVSHIQAYNM